MIKTIITAIFILFAYCVSAQVKITKEDRAYWNGFVEYVEAHGLKGSSDLNRKDLGLAEKLFNQYNKANKRVLNYSAFITLVQADIKEYREQALAQIRTSRAKHSENPDFPLMFDGTDEEFMPGLSIVDGFAGVKTTSWKFPNEIVLGLAYLRTNDIYRNSEQFNR
ncbi:hypothetical protein [Mucilaginibacter lacusdianchii]|uniref:hypothetical protein n=1 Tax=Mucilaginibacter lacusdianchii TaxID=2684211 RepID=UPI00131BBDFE|nr:hypothetical protein [Mucilaginibacter sp. JXJ CY 39]